MSSASSGSQPGVAPIGPWRPRIALALAALAGLTGLAALFGWLRGSLGWAGGVAGYVAMAPSTALSMVALAGALAVRIRQAASRGARIAADSLCALVALHAATVLVQLAAGLDLGLDRILAPAAAPGTMAGRMSPVTAALLVCFALAMIFELAAGERPRVRDLVTITAGVVLAGTVSIMVSYALGAPFLYSGGVVPVALPTAVAAALLAAALLATRHRRAWGATASLAIALVIVIGVAVTLACYGVVTALARERAHASFVRRASALATAVERSMVENFDEVKDAAARFANEREADPGALRRFLADRVRAHPAILALGWAPRVAPDGVAALEESARRDRERSFRVHAPGGAAPAGPGPRYPLRFVAGPAVGPALVGLDLASEPALREVFEAAERSGELAAGGEVALPSVAVTRPAVWAAVPVIAPSAGEAPVIEGFAVGAFSLARLLAASLAGLNQGGVEMTIAARPAEGTAAPAASSSWARSFTLAGRTFQLDARPALSTARDARDWLPGVVLGGGLLLTVLFGLYLIAGARHAEEVSRMVEELRQSERRASESSSLLEQTVAAIPVPVFYRAKDGAYELCNAEFGRWLGRDPAAVVGERAADLDAPGDLTPLLRSADDSLLAAPASQAIPMTLEDASGEKRETIVHKASVLGARGQVRGVVGVVFDVTERTRAEALQAALLELSEAAHTATGLADLLPNVHRVIARLMPARNCYVALVDPASGMLTFPYFVDEEDAAPPAPRRPGRGLTEYVLRTGRPALVSPQRFAELAAAGEVETLGAPSIDWLGVPLVIEGAPRGVLAVQTYAEGVRYGERDRDLLTVVARSISEAIERTRAAAALRDSEERFRSLAASAGDAILTADSSGAIVYANPAAAAAFGYPEGMAGQRIDAIVPARFRTAHWAGFARAAGTGTSKLAAQAVELVAQRRDGSEFPVELSLSTWRAQGQVYFTAILRDVSERKKVEEQLLRAQRMEAVGRLAGGAAHDLNNAMQSMLSHVALARAGAADPSALERALAALTDEIGRAAGTTRQLLLFSQREVTRFEAVDLGELVRSSEPMLRPLLGGDARLQVDVAPRPLPVSADRGQLQQALLNLVTNAAEALPRGGAVTITAGAVDPGEVFLEVGDTGAGMTDEVRARIFEPFFTTKRDRGASGLGLAVTHGIVTSHGGRIAVESAPGRGTRVRIALPRLAAAEPSARPELGAIGRGRSVLLVEDEPGAREGLSAVLGLMGFEVAAVGSGEAALEAAGSRSFDVLLTDLVLPGVDGGEVARRLAAEQPAIRVVLMSGHTEDVVARERARHGEVRFLQKPFAMEALERELAAALAEGKTVDRG